MDRHSIDLQGKGGFMERNSLAIVTAAAFAGLVLLALTFVVR